MHRSRIGIASMVVHQKLLILRRLAVGTFRTVIGEGRVTLPDWDRTVARQKALALKLAGG